ncbi:acyl carrier protein [Streptomyces sp. DSM 44915]|uniref:Acyl carrier protein n=1 Tax=Streptomyces chisholmiae TaxID=3075540 RepID=A0ABU2JNN5_9ACTN|nr:acyl carrier protein [Streptomyces sp. DSM 44915]MDT0266594.1 acyl carrier protein [Streptomyces sp. DSM 44915]
MRKLRYREAEQWDSLGHMTLVVAIEDEFDVELSPDDALAIESFEVAAALVGERTGDG